MKQLYLYAVSLLLVFGGILSPSLALAATGTPKPVVSADPLVLETSPLPIDLEASPGTSVSADLRVKQAGDTTVQLKVSVMKFAAYGDSGKPELLERGPGDSYFDWVHFDKTTFSAPPNVWETVHMTINLPKSAAFGYYYAIVFSRVGDDVLRGGDTNSIAGATATLVLLDALNPNAKRTLQLDSFTAEHRVFEFLPAAFNVKLSNTGNVYGAPTGDVFIMRGKKQLAALPINEGAGNILSQSVRVFPVTWSDGFPNYEPVVQNGVVKLDKKGNQVTQLVWSNGVVGAGNTPHLRFGEYTAQLVALYDDGTHQVPITASLTFWVIPWRLLLAALVLIALIGFGVYATVRATVRRAARGARRLSRRK